ncbi:hypothetical protein, partial [Streptomyces katsurahamanus]|uniref:hypothetical protein n=1 Tax=Streptomyces katsurahamanus TaxID=2577098 RepID=UPI001E4BC724
YNSDKAMDRSFVGLYAGISPILDPLTDEAGNYVDAAGVEIVNPTRDTIVKAMVRGVTVSLAPEGPAALRAAKATK